MERLRTCIFRPYVANVGPLYRLTMWDSGKRDARGQTIIRYRLADCSAAAAHPLFEGSDFAGSPMHADDSDATVRSLMTLLTLRPGDANADYFMDYSERQLEFCRLHAEALAAEVARRFGED